MGRHMRSIVGRLQTLAAVAFSLALLAMAATGWPLLHLSAIARVTDISPIGAIALKATGQGADLPDLLPAPILDQDKGLLPAAARSTSARNAAGETGIRPFSSTQEMQEFIVYYGPPGRAPVHRPASVSADSWSTTNIQVAGVDEADTVKSDGKYIYLISEREIMVVLAYPPEQSRVLARIPAAASPVGLLVNGNKLAVIEQASTGRGYIGAYPVTLRVFDLTDKGKPVLVREVAMDGIYVASRMIGQYVYLVVGTPVHYAYSGSDWAPRLPRVYSGSQSGEVAATDILHGGSEDLASSYTTVMAISALDDSLPPVRETFLLGWGGRIYMSRANLYVAEYISDVSMTIHRISVAGDRLEYNASARVPGPAPNQFSMDEHDGFFRIATTIRRESRNDLYVLDSDFRVAGALENLAPGETTYAALFAGDRAYLATANAVDPFFVIDLADPYRPKLLGELKKTGYSDYLQPYDEDHVIGIGLETEAAVEGEPARYRGVKVSLFDVTDVASPREIGTYEIGDRGTSSQALEDHKAVLLEPSRNLLVLPILLVEIDRANHPGSASADATGRPVWQGAYVFDISLKGLALRGRMTHFEGGKPVSGFYGRNVVYRTLYIEDALYTVSDGMIKVNHLSALPLTGWIDTALMGLPSR